MESFLSLPQAVERFPLLPFQVDLGTIGLMVRHFPQVLYEITLTIHCSDSFDHGFRPLQLATHHIAACQLMSSFL